MPLVVTLVKLVLALGLAIVAIVFFVAGDMPHPVAVKGSSAGFLDGYWHGFLGVWSALALLFGGSGTVYQVVNNGGWYHFGYFLGGTAFLSIVSLVEVPGRMLTGRRSPFEAEERDVTAASRSLGAIAVAAIAILVSVILYFVHDGSLWPAMAPKGTKVADVGWFSGLAHGATFGLNALLALFLDDHPVFQAGGGDGYAVGFKTLGLLALVWKVINAPLTFVGPRDR